MAGQIKIDAMSGLHGGGRSLNEIIGPRRNGSQQSIPDGLYPNPVMMTANTGFRYDPHANDNNSYRGMQDDYRALGIRVPPARDVEKERMEAELQALKRKEEQLQRELDYRLAQVQGYERKNHERREQWWIDEPAILIPIRYDQWVEICE